MAKPLILRDPDVCPVCGRRGRVIKTKRHDGYIWRRHACRESRHGRWSSHHHLVPLRDIDAADIRPEYLRTARRKPREASRTLSLF